MDPSGRMCETSWGLPWSLPSSLCCPSPASAWVCDSIWFPSDAGRPLDEVVKPGKRVQHAIIYMLTLLSLPGIAAPARRNRFSAALFGIWRLLDPAVYYVIQYEDRYRMPILWMTFLLGAFGGMSLLEYMLRKIPFVSDDSALLPGPRAPGTHDAR